VPESRLLSELVPQIELSEAEQAERRRRFPGGAAIEFVDLEEHNRAGALDRLREAEPVSWVPALTQAERSEGDAQPAAIHAAPCAEIRQLRGFDSLGTTLAKELTEVRDGTSETTTARTIAELGTGGYSIAVHQSHPPFKAVLCAGIPSR
jgi:hypothetical protein